jgi:succinate dehydrogenase / fumarate reductase, cytochrome b subunit
MNAIDVKAVFTTTIGQKLVMALTGLFLCSFLIVHLAGNITLLLPPSEAAPLFNAYSEFMSSNPIIRTLELGLVAGFLFHIIYGIRLAIKNRASRPVRYKMYRGDQTARFYSRFMFYSGMVVLLFLFLHLAQFFFIHRFGFAPENETMYDSVVRIFSQPFFSIIYLVCMILLAFHLAHGFQSAFQSLGLQVNKLLTKRLILAGNVFAILICTGFATIPLFFLMRTLL